MKTLINIKSTPALVAREFAEFLLKLSLEKEFLNIALSGGSTPALLFDILAADYKDKIDWVKVHFYWGDERCVPPDHEESNYKMTVDHLLAHINIPDENIHRVNGENNPEEEAKRYADEILENVPEFNGLPQFDIIMLGMGTDGHTASIFPHEMELLTAKTLCAVATHPDSGQKRVSLTGPIINSAANICFLVTGESKNEKISEIFGKNGNWTEYPAAHVKSLDGRLYWFLDENAAGDIEI